MTEQHEQLARDLSGITGRDRIERIAERLALLEHTAAVIAITERQIVGSTDRWIRISDTSPSRKTLFVCRSCGAKSPAPNKNCPQPVTIWNGEQRACADWEPCPHERQDVNDRSLFVCLDCGEALGR